MAWARESPDWNGAGPLPSSGGNINLPQNTAAADTIVVAISMQGTASVSIAGAGATWVNPVESSTAPLLWIFIGYNCSSGHATIVPTYSGSGGSYVVGMFTGGPTASSPVLGDGVTSGSNVTAVTSPSESYAYGNLIIGGGSLYNAFGSTLDVAATWSNGSPTTVIGANQVPSSDRGAFADYVIGGYGGGSTTVEYTCNSESGSGLVAAGIIVLQPLNAPPTGNPIDMVM